MTATNLTIWNLPVKPPTDSGRTPALIGKEVDQIMRQTREHITVASIAIGYRLMEAKRLEGHGGWLPWLAARDINERTARRTMELAAHHEYLTEAHPEKLPDFMARSLRQALAIVHADKAERGRPGKPRGKGRSKVEAEDADEPPELEIMPPDPVHVIHHLAQQWPADAIGRHQLTREQADLLEQDLPALLPALLDLAERHDVSTGIEAADHVPPHQSRTEQWAEERRAIEHSFASWLMTAPVDKIVATMIDRVPRERLVAIFQAVLFDIGPVGTVTEYDAIPEPAGAGGDTGTGDPAPAEPIAAPAASRAGQKALDKQAIDELRDWAKTIDRDRLHGHVETTAPKVAPRLSDFLAGKHGSYHLHAALKQVRADLADYS